MTSTIRSSVAVLALAIAACASQPDVRPTKLPVPDRPIVPRVAPAELACLSKDAYTEIVNRERGYKTWGLELEAIILKNNAHADEGH